MSKVVFVTGTDTDVGKSVVSGLLAAGLSKRGVRFGICKPVESGCARLDDGSLLPADAALLWELSGKKQALSDVVLYCFEPAISPHLAARAEGVGVSIDSIVSHIATLRAEYDVVVVEGAGGLLVPIVDGYTFADLAAALDASVLLVCASRLGVLNHASLSFEVIAARSLSMLGYVVNEVSAADAECDESRKSNREALAEIASGYGVKECAAFPHLGELAGAEDLLSAMPEVEVDRLIAAVCS